MGLKPTWIRWDKPLPAACTGLIINPGFNLPGGKYVIATKHRLLEAQAVGAKVLIYTCDYELLNMWWAWVAENKIKHALATNFKKPWKVWKAPTNHLIEHSYYDISRLLNRHVAVSPAHSVAYVGWPKVLRMRILKAIGYQSLVMMGFGADKQRDFPAVRAEAGTPWPLLGELYPHAAYHLCVSDKEHGLVQSAVSRPIEAWAYNRPCAFHTSMLKSRPDLHWDPVKPWTFETAAELWDIVHRGWDDEKKQYDLAFLAEEARLQRESIGASYYQWEPNPALKEFFA
jgi:hypothetical protein